MSLLPHLLIRPCLSAVFFRCQGQERRISVTLRSTEGELGELIVTVVAALTPVKVAKVPSFHRIANLYYILHLAVHLRMSGICSRIYLPS